MTELEITPIEVTEIKPDSLIVVRLMHKAQRVEVERVRADVLEQIKKSCPEFHGGFFVMDNCADLKVYDALAVLHE